MFKKCQNVKKKKKKWYGNCFSLVYVRLLPSFGNHNHSSLLDYLNSKLTKNLGFLNFLIKIAFYDFLKFVLKFKNDDAPFL